MQGFIAEVQTYFHPRQLEHCVALWDGSDKDEHIVNIVKWMALLFTSAKQIGQEQSPLVYKKELACHLEKAAKLANLRNVHKPLVKEMKQALQKLEKDSKVTSSSNAPGQQPSASSESHDHDKSCLLESSPQSSAASSRTMFTGITSQAIAINLVKFVTSSAL